MFIPDYESAPTRYRATTTTYGCWTATALVVHKGWVDEEALTSEATQHDFAFAVVGPGGKSGVTPSWTSVGSFPIRFDAVPKGTTVYAFGYPAAGKYDGTKLTYCAGPVGFDAWNGNATYKLACDMTGGSSGGPWFVDFDEGTDRARRSRSTPTATKASRRCTARSSAPPPEAVYDAANTVDGNTIVGN